MEAQDGFTFTDFEIKRADGTSVLYRLCFDYNLLCDTEQECRLNLLMAVVDIDLCSASQLRAVMLSMMKHAHPESTLKTAGELLSADMYMARKAIGIELMKSLHLEDRMAEAFKQHGETPDTKSETATA